MAEVLEAMGFPSEWCERALKSASGLETAVDLLLQWQAHGLPQFTPSSVRPSSPPPASSSGKNVQQYLPNSSSSPSGEPTLRLLPLPKASSSSLMPSSSTPCPSSVDGPSRVNNPGNSDSSFPRDCKSPAGVGRNSLVRLGPSEQLPESQMPVTGNSSVECQMPVTGNSSVECASRSPQSGRSSNIIVDNLNTTDAVVPDSYAEERKARYLAARRAKQEKEEEKAKIRQHMQEDMAYRRLRHTYQSPSNNDRSKSSLPEVQCEQQAGGSSTSHKVSMGTAVELQIRCPGCENMKASFTAGTKLKDVRAYVEHHLQQPLRILASQDQCLGLQQGAGPFTGQSVRLSSDRQAEREILKAARENFEVQTSRILATAKTLRDNDGVADASNGQNRGTIYFLIPFPRQEFFTELAMESTLLEAQLVPRGTVVVQFRPSEVNSLGKSVVQPEESSAVVDNLKRASDSIPPNSHAEPSSASLLDDDGGALVIEDESVRVPPHEHPSSFDPATNGRFKSGRTLETEGERVRVRELALQAAAKRMTEAAKIFHAGLPLREGETSEGFHFPTDSDHHRSMAEVTLPIEKNLSCQRVLTASNLVALEDDDQQLNAKAAGADAELLNTGRHCDDSTGRHCDDGHSESDGQSKSSTGRALDALHRQAMAAAEARIRTSQGQPNVLGADHKQEAEQAESRVAKDETESRPVRARARIPQSSRLLSRPEKLQRTSESYPPISPVSQGHDERQVLRGTSSRSQPQVVLGSTSCRGPLEAALQRVREVGGGDSKGKGILEETESTETAVPSSSLQAEAVGSSSLRVRLVDGNVVLRTFPEDTVLQTVRDSVVPEGAVASEYGFVVPFPEPHFVEGEALSATLNEVGLVPHGTIHLMKLASRGVVRQGRRSFRHRQRHYLEDRQRHYVEDSDDEDDDMEHLEGMFMHFTEHLHNRPDPSYEELMELEESIGRVHVGVPEEVITTLPTHIVTTKIQSGADGAAGVEEELDLCIVCMSEMVNGEEALSLPCMHTFHTHCIRQWLLRSTCCPTCKHSLV